jgi:hypothetical protein
MIGAPYPSRFRSVTGSLAAIPLLLSIRVVVY